MCVQNFNDSRGLAIRITYRISLRSSSLWEPRHPLLKVVSMAEARFGVHPTPLGCTLWLKGTAKRMKLTFRVFRTGPLGTMEKSFNQVGGTHKSPTTKAIKL